MYDNARESGDEGTVQYVTLRTVIIFFVVFMIFVIFIIYIIYVVHILVLSCLFFYVHVIDHEDRDIKYILNIKI